jgi:hypothetical protein
MDTAPNSEDRKKLAGIITQINKGKIPAVGEPSLEDAQLRLATAASRVEDARRQFQKTFESNVAEISGRLEQVASDPRFRQAVLLQNRKAVTFGLDSVLDSARPKKRGKKERQSEELIASYLQRYCVKNDSIGFFGPIGWIRFEPEGESITLKPGSSLIARSHIYFEHWAIQALAGKAAACVEIRPWLAPRLLPNARLNGDKLTLPDGASITLSHLERTVLEKCTGQWTARQIASQLIKLSENGLQSEAEAFAELENLLNRQAITWSFTLPAVLHPEQEFRAALMRIEDEQLRNRFLLELDELEQARAGVEAAMDDAGRLHDALVNLEETFTRISGQAATRFDGRTYSGRTLVYNECLRDLEMAVGPEITAELAPPLSLLLASARWFTYHGAEIFKKAFEELHAAMAAQSGSATIDMWPFWVTIRPKIFNDRQRLFQQLLPELQRLWSEILQIPEGQRRVRYSSAELKNRVEEAFAAPRPGWRLARYQSPDFMIAAGSVEDIRRGDYEFILGEVHVGNSTVRPSIFMSQHPRPEEMFEAMSADFPEGRIQIVPPISFRRYGSRARAVLHCKNDYFLEISDDSISWQPSRTASISEFVIEPGPRGLIARTRDHRLQYDLLEFYGEALSNEVLEYMDFIPSRAHLPRINIDRLVIQRESWQFPMADLQFALAENEADRFMGARRWRQRHQLPRYAFVRVPLELKPFYLDFDSPVYVEILAKMLRRTMAEKNAPQILSVSEMLPSCDQIWLPDAQGLKYTCEFRITAVDQAVANCP